MTESGNPKDNAVAERVNSTLKNEFFRGRDFSSVGEVREALRRAVQYYNHRRLHRSISTTPANAARMTGELRKQWVSYREKYIKTCTNK